MVPYILGGNDPAIFEHKNNIWREFIKDVCRVGCFPTVEDLPFFPLLPVLSPVRGSGPGFEVILSVCWVDNCRNIWFDDIRIKTKQTF